MEKFNGKIDHSLLNPNVTQDDIIKLCAEARAYKFNSVCVAPQFVKIAKEELTSLNIKVCSVVDFPFGFSDFKSRASQIIAMLQNGCDEFEIVLQYNYVKNRCEEKIIDELIAIKKIVKNKTLKVVIESSLYTSEDKNFVCNTLNKTEIDYIVTATGFHSSAASIEDIIFYKENLKEDIKIKVSGGVNSLEKLNELLELNVNSIGTSVGVNLILQAND